MGAPLHKKEREILLKKLKDLSNSYNDLLSVGLSIYYIAIPYPRF
jgi:hypothetical protein